MYLMNLAKPNPDFSIPAHNLSLSQHRDLNPIPQTHHWNPKVYPLCYIYIMGTAPQKKCSCFIGCMCVILWVCKDGDEILWYVYCVFNALKQENGICYLCFSVIFVLILFLLVALQKTGGLGRVFLGCVLKNAAQKWLKPRFLKTGLKTLRPSRVF